MSFFLLLNSKEDFLKNDWNFGTIDFHSIFFNFVSTMEVNGAKNCLVPIVFQNIFLCVQQKKETHTGFQQLEGEKMITEFSFLGGVSL